MRLQRFAECSLLYLDHKLTKQGGCLVFQWSSVTVYGSAKLYKYSMGFGLDARRVIFYSTQWRRKRTTLKEQQGIYGMCSSLSSKACLRWTSGWDGKSLPLFTTSAPSTFSLLIPLFFYIYSRSWAWNSEILNSIQHLFILCQCLLELICRQWI